MTVLRRFYNCVRRFVVGSFVLELIKIFIRTSVRPWDRPALRVALECSWLITLRPAVRTRLLQTPVHRTIPRRTTYFSLRVRPKSRQHCQAPSQQEQAATLL